MEQNCTKLEIIVFRSYYERSCGIVRALVRASEREVELGRAKVCRSYYERSFGVIRALVRAGLGLKARVSFLIRIGLGFTSI